MSEINVPALVLSASFETMRAAVCGYIEGVIRWHNGVAAYAPSR
ncbi:MAG: hypothetical protein ABSG43_17950 [Solirubrobacteraceae bacterium]